MTSDVIKAQRQIFQSKVRAMKLNQTTESIIFAAYEFATAGAVLKTVERGNKDD